MVIRGRRLEAECDGLGRGDDVLSYNCEALIEGMRRGTPAVSHGGCLVGLLLLMFTMFSVLCPRN